MDNIKALAHAFWKWFEDQNMKFLMLDDIDKSSKEILLDELLIRLKKFDNNLFFEIGGRDNSTKKELIISAEGNAKYFSKVMELVNAAPKIENWEIIALKPPRGINFVTNYEDILLDPKKMKFIPLKNEKQPDLLGIKVLLENFDSGNIKQIKLGVYQVLDSFLGERTNSQEINFLDVGLLKLRDLESDALDLSFLPDYIKWRKKKNLTSSK